MSPCTRLALLTLAVGRALSAQVRPEPPPIHPVRCDEDYSYLSRPEARSGAWWERWKYLPLDDAGDVRLSVGAEWRAHYELFRHDQWGDVQPENHDYAWLRALPYADLHLGGDLRAFAQLIAAFELGDEDVRRSIDEDRADVLQAFGEVVVPGSAGRVTARMGRQVLAYGSERLISTRYGPNVLRAFDVAKLLYEGDSWRLDLFCGRPVAPAAGAFDDHADRNTRVWAAYATADLGFARRAGLDLYYIGLRKSAATFDQGTDREIRHTLGTRFFGAAGAWDWNYELFGQFGRFGGGDIRAWSSASETGHRFASLPGAPRLGLKVDVISGDRSKTDTDLETFDPLFPKGKYFGEIGLLGPYNLFDVHPSLVFDLGHGWSTEVASVLYWRQDTGDGVYDNGGHLLRGSGDSRERFIGTQFDASLVYEPDRNSSMAFTYSTFWPGAFLRDGRAGEQVHFVMTEFRWVF